MTSSTLTDTTAISCPKCGKDMWDNRSNKKNAKAPDYRCKNRACDGVIWPTKDAPKKNGAPPVAAVPGTEPLKKPTMREAYKQLTEWVLTDVADIYSEHGFDFPPEVAAACTQTLFIQACNAGKVE